MQMKESVELLDPKSDVVFKAIFSQDNELAHGARNSLISSFIGRKVKESYVFSNIRVRKNFDSFGSKLSCLVSATSMSHTFFQTSMFEITSTVL